jgi:hypothetical protein
MGQMKLRKKIMWTVIALVLALVVGWVLYYLFHFYLYNEYQTYVTSYETEQGSEFQPLKESSSSVEGMVLAAENDNLKLYTNDKTAEIAVFNKADQTITYSNPTMAEDDSIASNY